MHFSLTTSTKTWWWHVAEDRYCFGFDEGKQISRPEAAYANYKFHRDAKLSTSSLCKSQTWTHVASMNCFWFTNLLIA